MVVAAGGKKMRGLWDSVETIVRAYMRNSASYYTEAIMQQSAFAFARASVCAFSQACLLASYRFFHEMFEENEVIHLACFNEMVSGYRLGSKEAWVVRKPTFLERDVPRDAHRDDEPLPRMVD